MPINTVLGPIDPSTLGRTAMHEHLLIDARVWYEPPREQTPTDQKVTIENLGFVRWNLTGLEDNLLIDDPDLAVAEVDDFARAGGSGIVDLTVIGLGRRVEEYPQIARRSGLHIMAGCGFYLHASHPAWVEAASVDDLTAFLLSELRDGIGDTRIRPALIGEIGTGEPISERERRVLAAAGRAGAETGTAVNVHLDSRGQNALQVLDVLVGQGMAPERVILSHMDEHLDRDYHLSVAAAGAILEYDTFGSEFYFGSRSKDPTDENRMEFVRMLLDEGHGDQILFSCDVWVKAAMRRFGGMGYDHVLKRIVPALREEYGVTDGNLERILVDSPRRLLDRPEV